VILTGVFDLPDNGSRGELYGGESGRAEIGSR